MKHLLSLLFLCALSLSAQTTVNNGRSGGGVSNVSSLPATCTPTTSPNFVFLTTGTKGPYACTDTDTWTFLGGGSGSVTSVASGCGMSGGPVTNTGTLATSFAVNSQTGSGAYAVVTANCGKLVARNNASAVSDTIAQAGSSGFASGWWTMYQCLGAGGCTITPATSTINGASSLSLIQNQGAVVISNGTNYLALRDPGGNVTGVASSVDSEVALFNATGGKTIKRASLTGIPYLTSGVLGAATSAHVIGLFNSGTCSGYLKSDGSCDTPSGGGSGDVVGPGSATDNAVARYDSTTGKLLQNSGVTIDDSGNISTAGGISTGVGGGVAGVDALGQGTATSAASGEVGFMAPTSVTTPFFMTLPGAPTTGFLLSTGTTDPTTLTFVASTGSDEVVRKTSPTIVTPTIASLANANHDHSNSAGGGQISSTAVGSGDKQGNGTKFQMSTGSTTTNNCVKFDANGNTVDAGAACGGGGGGWSNWAPSASDTITTENSYFASEYSITSNAITKGIQFVVGGVFTTDGSPPAVAFQIDLCTVSGCGSGTVVTVVPYKQLIPGPNLTASSWRFSGEIVLHGATGVSGAFKSAAVIIMDGGGSQNYPTGGACGGNATANTTVAQYLRVKELGGSMGAGNSVTLTEFLVKVE